MMKTRRFLCLVSLVVALLGLPGCPDTPCTGGLVERGAQSQTSVILVGEQVRLLISPDIPASCDPAGTPVPESLSVELSDPDNQPVPNQATIGSPSTSSATVRFTPDKQGRFHVLAAFAPVGGIQQFELYAARDRSAEAPVQTLSQPSCAALERTRRGGWLCDTDFLRDGTLVRRFTSSRLAAAGDVVWVVSATQIQRFVDTGTALELSAAGLTNAHGAARFLLASADELVILHDGALQRITFDGTALASTGVTPWSPDSSAVDSTEFPTLLLRTSDQLAIVYGSTATGGFPTVWICPYQLQGGAFIRTAAACQRLSGEVVGFEPNVLWTGSKSTFSGTFDDVRRLEWTGTALADQASLPLGQNFKMTSLAAEARNTATPVIIPTLSSSFPRTRAFVAVYSPERRGILLELLDAELPNPTASATLLWGATATSSTGVRVRTRPSTP